MYWLFLNLDKHILNLFTSTLSRTFWRYLKDTFTWDVGSSKEELTSACHPCSHAAATLLLMLLVTKRSIVFLVYFQDLIKSVCVRKALWLMLLYLCLCFPLVWNVSSYLSIVHPFDKLSFFCQLAAQTQVLCSPAGLFPFPSFLLVILFLTVWSLFISIIFLFTGM